MHVYHHLENKQKLITQSQENEFGDKNKLETGPKWVQLLFFGCNNHQFLLDIIDVYHHIQNQRNLMIQSRKPQNWAILGPFCPILGQEFFFENRASSLF